jgi:hypothetical protein
MSDVEYHSADPAAAADSLRQIIREFENSEEPRDVTHVDRAIDTGNDESNVRESVRELNRQRSDRGELGEVAEPIERRYGDDEPKDLKQVTRDISNRHRLEKADAKYLMATGISPEEALELAKDPEWVKNRTGWSDAEVAEFVKSGETPPRKILAADDRTGIRPELRDHDRIGPDQTLTLRDSGIRPLIRWR